MRDPLCTASHAVCVEASSVFSRVENIMAALEVAKSSDRELLYVVPDAIVSS